MEKVLAMRRMKGFKALIRVDEALAISLKRFGEKSPQNDVVQLGDGCGRISSERIESPVDIPPFDRSAVDGYAIRSEDSYSSSRNNPSILSLKGTAEAGNQVSAPPISAGECVEIFTGAAVPRGADAVVMAEDCERLGTTIMVAKPLPRGANISVKGEDIRSGDTVVRQGKLIRPWHVGVLASIGCSSVAVRRPPAVGVFSTGNELADIRGVLKMNSILDSTRPMVASLLTEAGCKVNDGGIVGDSISAISGKMLELASSSDAVISIGGTSVGGKDLVPEAALSISCEGVIYHGVAIKPGKPFGFGAIKDKPLFMLPGYPVSALVGFESIILPFLSTWSGARIAKRQVVKAKLARRVPTTPGIRHYLRVKLEGSGDAVVATPIAITGSGLLSSITAADGIVVVGEDLEGLEEGAEVNVELLEI